MTQNKEFKKVGERVVGIFPREKGNQVVVKQVSFEKGDGVGWYLDLRMHFLPEGKDEWLPTRKGVTVREKEVGELIKGLTALRDTPVTEPMFEDGDDIPF